MSTNAYTVETIQPNPARAKDMPYAPAVRIVGACDLMFLSGATASSLYHHHPHHDDEHVHPHSIEQQTKNAMDAIKSILDEVGATWADVVKTNTYVTDFDEFQKCGDVRLRHFGVATPTSTTVGVTRLAGPDFMIEVEAVAVVEG